MRTPIPQNQRILLFLLTLQLTRTPHRQVTAVAGHASVATRQQTICASLSLFLQNAYLTGEQTGNGWRCNRGYRATETTCLVIRVPENAHIDYSGNDWDCDPQFRKDGNSCTLPQ